MNDDLYADIVADLNDSCDLRDLGRWRKPKHCSTNSRPRRRCQPVAVGVNGSVERILK